jgi:hypothetical protein
MPTISSMSAKSSSSFLVKLFDQPGFQLDKPDRAAIDGIFSSSHLTGYV